ncbi:MAG: hypothetical protein GY697_13100, partial [Desulfobacterales bacterium]|nr:hypothetical protein [Desulfobacterales bacterium]
MYPFLKPGDRLVIRKTSPTDFQIGDILVFHTDQRLTVHRAIKTLPDQQFITKGDAMTTPDRLSVQAGAVVGKVALILRGRRLIAVSSGHRERLKKLYVWLSVRNLTWGAIKVNVKQVLFRKPAERKNVSRVDDRLKNQRWLRDLICGKQSVYAEYCMDLVSFEMAAVQEGIAGYLYPILKQCGAPEETVAVFKKHYLTIAARNLTGQSSIARLEGDLQKAQMRIMILKGASLPETVYPRPGLRMMEDIDILVRSEDQKKFIALLGRHGYQVDPGRGHCFLKGNIIVDLHTNALNVERVASRKWLFPAGMQPVWDQAVPWREGFQQIRRPSDEDTVLLLAQHALKHSCARIIWLVDLWLLLRNRDSDFCKALYTRAVHLHQTHSLYLVLFLLEREFGLVAPAPFQSPGSQISWLAKQLLILRADGRTDAYTGILLPLFSIPGFKKRLAFAWESVFLNRA